MIIPIAAYKTTAERDQDRIKELEKRVASLETALVEVIEKLWPGQSRK